MLKIFEKKKMNSAEYITQDDVFISSCFPRELTSSVHPLVEYRIKLCAKSDTIIHAGEIINIETSFLIDRKMNKLCIYMKPYEYLPLHFESGGFIHPRFTGRIIIGMCNYTTQDIKIPAGSPIAYALCQPYTM